MADQQHLLLRLLLLVLLLLICVQGTCSATAATDAHALNFEKAYAGYLDVLKAPQLLTAAKTYQRLMAHKHSLSEGQLARSLVYTGANLRLRRVLNKLLAGAMPLPHDAIAGVHSP
jgi:phage-related holin